jgi:exodeoxyribonuclease V gamma subunit
MQQRSQAKPTAFFSNRLEILAARLGEQLFEAGSDPFENRFVIVPHHSLKLYLLSFLASHRRWQIAAGIEIKTLIDGTKQLLQGQDGTCHFPSQLELSFKIEDEILSLLKTDDSFLQNAEWKALLGYLDFQKTSDLDRHVCRKKIISLSEELSKIFYQYATVEHDFLDAWLCKVGWKQEIWKRIFSSHSEWVPMVKKLVQSIPSVSRVHIFGLSSLPSKYLDFFDKTSSFYYFLSPCEMFWEDLYTDKERVFLEKIWEGKKVRFQVRQQMSFYLRERNSLLANWGKAGRSLLRNLGIRECYIEEDYDSPLQAGSSLLKQLQSQLLMLESPEHKSKISENDESLLCVSATSKLREVEVLLEMLYGIMGSANESIQPKDVLVLCPSLESYLPYIHMVFGAEACKLPYSIHGLPLHLASESIQAMEYLFSFCHRRFDLDSILKWFSWPNVQQKLGWDARHVHLIERWFKKARLLWGIDLEQKKQFLDLSNEENGLFYQGTWEEAFDRLLIGLALNLDTAILTEKEIPDPWPLSIVEWTEAEFLGELIHVLTCLKEDLKPILKQEEKTFSEWASLAVRMIDVYFVNGSYEQGMKEEIQRLDQHLRKNQAPISFDSFHRALIGLFGRKKESFHSTALNAVKFSPLEHGNAYPAKVVYLLGCDEGAFPRSQVISCLEETEMPKEMPSSIEMDRYLFLETMIHARQHLILSYQRMSWTDQKIQNPSLLIQELFSYLDQKFTIEGKNQKPSECLVVHHPAMSFHKSYFQKGSKLKSFSCFQAEAAKSYYGSSKKGIRPFFPAWHLSACLQSSIVGTYRLIDLKELHDFAKDPLRHHFKEKLGIYFDFMQSQDPEFFLSSVSKARMKADCLSVALNKEIEIAKAKREFPLGYFGEVAARSFYKETASWKENLSILGIGPEDLFSIELSETCRKAVKQGARWIVPALELTLDNDCKVVIKGELFPVSGDGMICVGHKNKIEEMMRIWPQYLVFLCVAPSLGVTPECILAFSNRRAVKIENPEQQLKKYLTYFLRSYDRPSPLKAEWSSVLMEKKQVEFENKILPRGYQESFIDPYASWLFKRGPVPKVEDLYVLWQKDWEEALFPLLQQKVPDEEI